MVSRDSVVDSDWLHVTDVTVMIRYGRGKKIGGGVLLCAERTAQGKDFELILTVKWKLDIR